MSQLGFEPVFDSYLAVAAIGYGAVWRLLALKPQFGSLTPRRKISSFAALIVGLAGDDGAVAADLDHDDPQPAAQLVPRLLDTSRSMNLPAAAASRSGGSAGTALTHARTSWPVWRQKARCESMATIKSCRRWNFAGGKIKFPETATGEQTESAPR